MKATQFLTAQEALWLVKVIFDQTYSVVNTNLQRRDQSQAMQQPTLPKPSRTSTRVVVVPGRAAANGTKKQAADQSKDKLKSAAAAAQQQKPMPKSYAAVKPRGPIRPH